MQLLVEKNHTKETEDLLEALRANWLTEDEYLFLTQLLQKKELELINRYIELQVTLRTLEEREPLHISIELEKELESYCKNPHISPLKNLLLLREYEQVLTSFLTSLGLSRPPISKELGPSLFVREVHRMLTMAVKDEGYKLSFEDRLFLDDLLENRDKSYEDWQQLISSLKELLFWEGALDEMIEALNEYSFSQGADRENLTIQLSFFEKQLTSFHTHFGKNLTEEILPAFSELGKSYLMGKTKKKFKTLNTAYQTLKARLFQKSCDLHLCCMCHFSAQTQEFWAKENDSLKLHSLKGFYAHAGGSSASLLIFTCGAGKGHLSVTKALSEYAKGKYHVRVANTLEETLASTDVFKRLLMDFSQERLYNHLLKNEGFEWLKLITRVGPFFLMMQQESIEKQIRLEVLKQRPDLLISCFPSMNAMFHNVAKEFNIPLLIVSTDLDTDFFTKGMHQRACDLSYPKWKITLPYDTPEMRAIIEKRIPSKKVHVSGFPLRAVFKESITQEQRTALRDELGIAPESRVLLLMMGGVAGRVTEKYAAILAELNDMEVEQIQANSLHILCLCGDQNVAANREMRYKINALKTKSSRMTLQAIGSVANMALLMEIAEGLITKPGGPITNEALSKGLPMIFHAPFALMDWEVFNMEFCIKAHMGSRFKLQPGKTEKNKEQLVPLIKEAFKRRKFRPNYLFEMKDFGQEFLSLIDQLLCE